MKETLIAVVGVGLLAGGCSLSSPGGPVTTSALRENAAPLVISPEAPTGLGPVIEDKPDQSVAGATRGGIEPISALGAAERARARWETLHPDEALKAGADPERRSTLAAAPMARSRSGNYDRNAAMQSLVDGGKNAGRRICDGC